MNENLSPHRDRNYPSEILISLIVKLACITAPKSQSSDSLFMILKIFHSGSISNVDCEDTTATISNK
jgi:hypothetical protein